MSLTYRKSIGLELEIMFLNVIWHSLLNRKGTVLLALISVAISIFVLLGVEHIRHEAKKVSIKRYQVSILIVGARTGQLNLLLYAVFRMGNPRTISLGKATVNLLPIQSGLDDTDIIGGFPSRFSGW